MLPRNGTLAQPIREKLNAARRRFLDHAPRALVQSWHDLLVGQRGLTTDSIKSTRATCAVGSLPLVPEPVVATWAAAFGRWMVYPSSCAQLQQHRFVVVCRSGPDARGGAALPTWPFIVAPLDSVSKEKESLEAESAREVAAVLRRKRRGHRRSAESNANRLGLKATGDAKEEAVLFIVFPRPPLSDLCANYQAYRLGSPHAARIFRLEGGDTLETCTTVWFEWASPNAASPFGASASPNASFRRQKRGRRGGSASSCSVPSLSVPPNPSITIRSVRLLSPTDVTRRFLQLPASSEASVAPGALWPGVIRELPIAFRWKPQCLPSLRVRAGGSTGTSLDGVTVPLGSNGLFLIAGLPSLLRLHLSNLVQAPCTSIALWHQRSVLVAAARQIASRQRRSAEVQPAASEVPRLTTELVMGMVLSTRRSFLMQGFCFSPSTYEREASEKRSDSSRPEVSAVPSGMKGREFGNVARVAPSATTVKATRRRRYQVRKVGVGIDAPKRPKRRQRRWFPHCATRGRRRRPRQATPMRRHRRHHHIRSACTKPATRRAPVLRLARRLALLHRHWKSKMAKLQRTSRREHRRAVLLEKRARRAEMKQAKRLQMCLDRELQLRERMRVVSGLLRAARRLCKGICFSSVTRH